MKKLLPLIILVALSCTSFGQFWKPKPKASPKPTPVVVEKSNSPIQDAKKIILELNNELKDTKDENSKLQKSLTQARLDIDQSFKEIDVLNKEIKDLKEWGTVQEQKSKQWFEKYSQSVKRYHRLKLIAALIAAAGGVLLGLQIMGFVPPPYNLLVPIGGAGFFASLIWMFL